MASKIKIIEKAKLENVRIISATGAGNKLEPTKFEVADIYKKVTDGDVIVTDIKSAEMTKVVENTFRAVNIAFANELAKICNHDGLDVYEIIKICLSSKFFR